MVPRFKPALDLSELRAAFRLPRKDDVQHFEAAFAELMGQAYAIAFPYGRTGIILLLEALGLDHKEIICPAYTCVVVPHAIVYSGNIPVFVDCPKDSFNMDLDQAEAAITENTGAIIATSIFGQPVDLDKIDEIRKRHPDILIIQDCAHSFAAKWKGREVQREGVAAIFGLNISKILTSVFGGMITTDNRMLREKLMLLRERRLKKPGLKKSIRRLFYLIAVYLSFWEPIYGSVNKLERSGLLDRFAKYYDESDINMPSDYLEMMTGLEARVGLAQTGKYTAIVKKRRQAAAYYHEHLNNNDCGLKLPPYVNGSTWSHYTALTSNREALLKKVLKKGVQLGRLIEYNIPEMKAYGAHEPHKFPVASNYAREALNLPVWGGRKNAAYVAHKFKGTIM